MKLPSLIMSFIVLFTVLSGLAHAQAQSNYWPVQEKLPDGRVRFKIIEEDPSLREHQNQISQHVIYNTILDAKSVPHDLSPMLSKVPARPHLPATGKPLWVAVKSAWTPADEDAYSAWFASLTTDFNSGTGLLADCADTGLLFRWVYARNHQLPIANTMTGSGKLFGNFSSNAEWDQLPTNADWKQDERFKAALRYLFDNTYTRTVVGDLYPTEVTPAYVRPGSLFMIIRPTSGHTQTIHDVDPNQGITTFWGNEPAAETIYSSPLIIEVQNKMTIGMWRYVRQVNTSTGLVWQLTPANEMPGYSLAQFQQTFNTNAEYEDWLDQQLGIQESDSTRLSILSQAFVQGLQTRLSITAESIPFCVATQCSPTSADYGNYSTFARDAKSVSEQQEIAALIQSIGPQNSSVRHVEQSVQNLGEVIHGSGLTYLALLEDPSLLAKFNPDPRVSYETRWGIASATPNPTLDFYSLSQALQSLLDERETDVINAFEACGTQTCVANSASVEALSTALLDAGIQSVYQQAASASEVSGVDPGALPAIRAYFSKDQIFNLRDPSCQFKWCTLDDLIWSGSAQNHLSKWSSNAVDPIPARWGY